MGAVNAFAEKIYKVLHYISCIFLVGFMALLLLNIITRALFKTPVFGTFEAVSYMSMFVVIFALAINEYNNGNIKVDMVTEFLRPKTRNILEIICDVISFALLTLVVYESWSMTVSKYTKGDLTNNLNIPQWIIALFLTIGFIILALCMFLKIITKITSHSKIDNRKLTKEEKNEQEVVVDVGII